MSLHHHGLWESVMVTLTIFGRAGGEWLVGNESTKVLQCVLVSLFALYQSSVLLSISLRVLAMAVAGGIMFWVCPSVLLILMNTISLECLEGISSTKYELIRFWHAVPIRVLHCALTVEFRVFLQH